MASESSYHDPSKAIGLEDLLKKPGKRGSTKQSFTKDPSKDNIVTMKSQLTHVLESMVVAKFPEKPMGEFSKELYAAYIHMPKKTRQRIVTAFLKDYVMPDIWTIIDYSKRKHNPRLQQLYDTLIPESLIECAMLAAQQSNLNAEDMPKLVDFVYKKYFKLD